MLVVQATREAERLEARIGVEGDDAVFIVVDALGNGAALAVDYQAHAAELVGDDAVGLAALDQVVRHIAAAAVDEAADHLVATVQFRHRIELALVQPALDGGAVDLFADAAVAAVDQVIDAGAARQGGLAQVAEYVIAVVRDTGRVDLAQLAVGGVAVGGAVIGTQAILVVVAGDLAAALGTVAIGVVLVAANGRAILAYCRQATVARLVVVRVGVAAVAVDDLFFADATERVTGITFAEQDGAALFDDVAGQLAEGGVLLAGVDVAQCGVGQQAVGGVASTSRYAAGKSSMATSP